MNRKDFSVLREKISKKRLLSGKKWSYFVGKRRQEVAMLALQELKKEGKIHDFLPTGDLSFQDVVKGIDFYAVCVGEEKYITQPFSVTGEVWAEGDKIRHPEIPVVTIDLSDTLAFVKNKIMKAIDQNK